MLIAQLQSIPRVIRTIGKMIEVKEAILNFAIIPLAMAKSAGNFLCMKA